MTLNAVGDVPAPNAKTGQRGKSTHTPSKGFDEALAESSNRKPATAGAREQAEDFRSVWKTSAYVANLGLGNEASLKDGGSSPEDLMLPADEVPLPVPAIDPTIDATLAADAPQQVQAEAPSPTDVLKAMLNELGADRSAQEVDSASEGADPDAESRAPTGIDARGNPVADNAEIMSKPAIGARAVEQQVPSPALSPASAAGRNVDTSANLRVSGDTPTDPDKRSAEGRPQADASRTAARLVQEVSQPSGTSRETIPAGPANDATAARVNVLGFSGALAPAPTASPLLGATPAGVVSAIEGDLAWRQAAADPAHTPGQRTPSSIAGVNTLRIQLNPAELGMVTARLTATGSQLSIEIQVESNDARQRLASDSDAILKALRSVGYDVEKVTIQQQPQSTQPNAQVNNSAGREHFQSEQQTRDGANARGQSGQDSSSRGNDGETRGRGEPASDRSGNGVYI